MRALEMELFRKVPLPDSVGRAIAAADAAKAVADAAAATGP